MNEYDNHLHVFMMTSNKGTYITSNTLMKIAKYNNMIRFDSDDIMKENCVERIMTYAQSYDFVRFYLRDFGDSDKREMSWGHHAMRKNVFEKYGGYQAWPCSADAEMLTRLKLFTSTYVIKEELVLRRVHDESLTNKPGPLNLNGERGAIRQKYYDIVMNLNVTDEKDAIIKCVTNTYNEIFVFRKDSGFRHKPVSTQPPIKTPVVKSIIQPNFAECSGNFCNPVAVFTCCFNGETPRKHVLEGADFYCFTNEPRNIDGWKTIVVDNFIKDPRWGARYIQFHPTRYMQGYDKMIYIDPAADLLPDVNLEFKEPISLADGRPIYEVIEPSLIKMFEMANVKKLVMSKKDDLILYNFKNRETNKLLTSLWANFNQCLHPLRFALALPQYQKYSIGKIKGLT